MNVENIHSNLVEFVFFCLQANIQNNVSLAQPCLYLKATCFSLDINHHQVKNYSHYKAGKRCSVQNIIMWDFIMKKNIVKLWDPTSNMTMICIWHL